MAKANSVTLRVGNDYVLQSRGKTVATIIGSVACDETQYGGELVEYHYLFSE